MRIVPLFPDQSEFRFRCAESLGSALRRVECRLCRFDGLSPLITVVGTVEFGEPLCRGCALVKRFAEHPDLGREALLFRFQTVAFLDRGRVAFAGFRSTSRGH